MNKYEQHHFLSLFPFSLSGLFDTVDIGFQLDQIESRDCRQPSFLNTGRLIAEDLDALLQVFSYFL